MGILSALSVVVIVTGLHQLITYRKRKLDTVIFHDEAFRERSHTSIKQTASWLRYMAHQLQGFSTVFLNEKRRATLEQQLDQASLRQTPEEMAAEQLVGGILGSALGCSGFLVGSIGIFTFLFLGWAGWMQPRFVLQRIGQRRQKEIDEAFIPLIDMLALLLESGASLYTGLEKAGTAVGGALGEEIKVTMKQSHSRGLSDALYQWSNRVMIPDITGLVTLLNQAGKYGAGMNLVYTLRQFSFSVRSNKRNGLDREVQKVGIKMLFPTFFCILMPMMAILFAPVLLSLGKSGLL